MASSISRQADTTIGSGTTKVLFFGRLREMVGSSEELLALAGHTTIAEVFAYYAERRPGLAEFRGSVAATRNREFVAWETPVRPGDEVAFLPPVSGG
jgi:molybdopterin synthase sulfur carrier subunit